MILPTKRLSRDRALLSVGAEILRRITEPKTVSRLWDELSHREDATREGYSLTYDWFILALDLLFMLHAIDLRQGKIERRSQ